MSGRRELRLEAHSATSAAAWLSAAGRSALLSGLSTGSGRWFD